MQHLKKKRAHLIKHLDKKLRSRLRMYFLIAVIMIFVVIYNYAVGKLDLAYSFFGVAGGVIIGVITSRMYHISWNHDAQQVVSRFDRFGGIVLGGYIVFEICRELVFHHYFASFAGAATFAVLAGVMIGRVLGTRGKIAQILKEQNVFHL